MSTQPKLSGDKPAGGVCRQPVIGIDASRANAAKRTGTEWYAFHLIQRLKKIIPGTYQIILYSKEPLRDGLEKLPPNWESHVLKWPPGRFWTQIRLSWEMLRRPPDVLFVPAHALPLILPKAPVTTIHDVAFMAEPKAYTFAERLYHRFAAKFAVRRAVSIFTVSDFSRAEIEKYFHADVTKIKVTPLGYDEEHCRRAADQSEIEPVLTRYKIKQPYFLFVGRLEAKKNLAGLIEAFSRFGEKHPEYGLALVGKRGVGCDQAMKTLSHRPVLRKRITEAGYVCEDDMRFLYSGATALVLPSWYEGFGLPVVEAFACGTPVIASDRASLPEVGGDAALYVDPADPDDIAAAMTRLVEEAGLAAELSAKGLARVREFSWDRTAELTWEELRRVGAVVCS